MKKNYALPLPKILLALLGVFGSQLASSQVTFQLLNQGFGNSLFDINDSGQAIKSGGVYDYTTNTTAPLDPEVLGLNGINNNGDLIGTMPMGEFTQPGYKQGGTWHPMGYFPGANNDAAFSLGQISENGTYIAGQMSPDCCDFQAFLYNTTTGTIEKIAAAGNEYGAGYTVNNSGIVGGWYDPLPEGTLRVAAYMTTGSVITRVPPEEPEAEGQIGAISNSGLMVGDRNGAPFLYDQPNNIYTTFEVPDGYDSATFTSVSENGVAVGYAQIWTPDGPIRDAIIYHPSLGVQPVFIKSILADNGIAIGTFDELLGTAISISPDGNYVCGWGNGFFLFAEGWALNFDDLLLSTCYIQCPQDIAMVSLDGPKVVEYMLNFSCDENPDAAIVLVSGPESGSTFPYGTTEVVHNLVDLGGNILNTCSFSVTINEFYCIPDFENIEPITRVNVAGIDNTSAADATEAYEDFTAVTGTVTAGEEYTAIFEGFTGGEWTDFITVYTDWNHNGIFESTERSDMGSLTNSTGIDGVQATGTLSVPADAVIGSTTMRVAKTYDTAANTPCAPGSGYGQVEDYTLVVEEALATQSFNADAFKYYPNPAKETLYISNNNTIETVTVYNMIGQQVLSKNIANHSAQISLSGLAAGNYVVKATTSNAVKTFKILKQ